MATIPVHVGPFSAVFVGLASGLDSSVLTEMVGLTTSAHSISLDIPEVFNYSAQNSLQSGPVQMTATISFLSDDVQAWRLSYGNFLDAIWQDTAPVFPKLCLLLIHPDPDAESSFLIPTCYCRKQVRSDFSKSAPTQVQVQFVWQQLNRFAPIYFKRTVDQLSLMLGSRTPL